MLLVSIDSMNHPSLVTEKLLRSRDFWWLIGYIQGDGFVDTVGREEIRLTSVDYDLIDESKRLIHSLFGLEPAL